MNRVRFIVMKNENANSGTFKKINKEVTLKKRLSFQKVTAF